MPNNSTNFLANPIFLALVCVQIIIALLFSFTQKQGSKYQELTQNILSILVRLPLGEMCTLAHIGGMRLNPIIKRALLKAVSDAYEGKESTIKPDSLPSSRYSC